MENRLDRPLYSDAVYGIRKIKVMAEADDGVIEAVYLEEKPWLRGYQWHPERLVATDGDNAAVFCEFIDACKKRTSKKEK